MWHEHEDMLMRDFEFPDFAQALDFVNRVGAVAEAQNHHPDITIHDYKYVLVETTTHDVGGNVTDKDRQLAKAIDKILA